MLLREHSVILLTFTKLLFVIKIFILSIFEWPLKTDFTVLIFLTLLINAGMYKHDNLKEDYPATEAV